MPHEFAEQVQPALPEQKVLLPYQENVLDSIYTARTSNVKSGGINIATGLGKTFIVASDVELFLKEHPDDRVLYLCHKAHVLEQASQEFSEVTGTSSHGHMFGGEYQDQEQLVFATFQSMGRKLGGGRVFEAFDPREFKYMVVDESHHAPAPTYRAVIDYFKPVFKLGMTATPERRDQQDLKHIFGPVLATILLEEAIAEGYLARPDYHVLTDRVRQLDDETIDRLSLKAINKMLFVPKRDEAIAATISEHLEQLDDPRTLIFCPSIPHTEYFASLLPGSTEVLHSKLSPDQKKDRLARFRAGDITTLLAVDMLNEGLDVPEINAEVFLRSTESKTVFFQQLGRGLRKIPGKESVLVLDFVASWDRLTTLNSLRKGIRYYRTRAVRGSRTPTTVETEASFTFSDEAHQAVKTIRHARDRKNQPKAEPEKPRLDKWALNEAAVKAMLGVDKLPNQRLTATEWKAYGRRIAAGDQAAKEELVLRFLRSMYGTAKQFAEKTGSEELTIEDHFHNAIEGLELALKNYDPTRHSSLRSYAQLSIFRSLVKRSAEIGLIKLPNDFHGKRAKLEAAERKLADQLGTASLVEISTEMLSEATGLSLEAVEDLRFMRRALVYRRLLRPVKRQLIDTAPLPFEQAAEHETKEILHKALEDISYRERKILTMHYGIEGKLPMSLDEVGRVFNITREAIRGTENRAIKKLELLPETQPLRQHIDEPRRTPSSVELSHQTFLARQEKVREQWRALALTAVAGNGRVPQMTPTFEKIQSEENDTIAGLAYAATLEMQSLTRRWSYRPYFIGNTDKAPSLIHAKIKKHDLAKAIKHYYLVERTGSVNHADYIQALNALERHGVIDCQRNERGSVIESVSLRQQ